MTSFYYSDGTYCKKFECTCLSIIIDQMNIQPYNFGRNHSKKLEIVFTNNEKITNQFLTFCNKIHKGKLCMSKKLKDKTYGYIILQDCYLSTHRTIFEDGVFTYIIEMTYFNSNPATEEDLVYFKSEFDKELLLEKIDILFSK